MTATKKPFPQVATMIIEQKTHKNIVMTTFLSFELATLVVFIINLQSVAQATKSQDMSSIHFRENFKDSSVWDINSLYRNQATIYNSRARNKRSLNNSRLNPSSQNQNQVVDSCQSKMEILTPYYARNSKGKLRTVVNSELMQQAIQVETCIRSPKGASKCNSQAGCGCEQKYKWHRLLVLDPHDTGVSKGLIMDWFLFPSSCICRCKEALLA